MKTGRYLVILLLLAVVGCPGEGPPPNEQLDSYYPMPDGHQQQPDQYQQQYPDLYPSYPDGPVQPQPDFWYQPPDQGYPGSAEFGCKQDSDCFGLKCCKTPWGVKLCAEVCENQ